MKNTAPRGHSTAMYRPTLVTRNKILNYKEALQLVIVDDQNLIFFGGHIIVI